MAGTIKANAVQLGDSATASQNFVLQTSVDGTAKLARGNLGATTQDILTVDAAGKVVTPVMPFVGTAPIVESGSNANGSWVKWADGTMLCSSTGTGAMTVSVYSGAIYRGIKTVTFPQAFISQPFITTGTAGDQATNGWLSASPVNNSSCNLVYFTIATTVTGCTLDYIAFGRWKA